MQCSEIRTTERYGIVSTSSIFFPSVFSLRVRCVPISFRIGHNRLLISFHAKFTTSGKSKRWIIVKTRPTSRYVVIDPLSYIFVVFCSPLRLMKVDCHWTWYVCNDGKYAYVSWRCLQSMMNITIILLCKKRGHCLMCHWKWLINFFISICYPCLASHSSLVCYFFFLIFYTSASSSHLHRRCHCMTKKVHNNRKTMNKI